MEQNEDLRRALEEMAGDSAAYFGKAQIFQERAASITGEAVSDDGHIKVSWNGDGLSGLEINPRAMRMGSAELAETILRLTEAAKADGRRQSEALKAEVFGEDNPADFVRNREALQDSLALMQRAFTGAIGDSRDLVENLRRRAGGA